MSWGGVIDLAIILLLSIPYLIYWNLIRNYQTDTKGGITGTLLFLIPIVPAFVLNLIDLGYYRHSLRRSGIEVLSLIKPGLEFITGIIQLYWWLLFSGMLLLYFFGLLVYKYLTSPRFKNEQGLKTPVGWITKVGVILILIAGLAGNKQLFVPTKPLIQISPALLPAAQNSFGTFLYSWVKGDYNIKRPEWVDEGNTQTSSNFIKQYSFSDTFSKQNVVVIILESFVAEVLREDDPKKAATPFLDSLFKHCIIFNNTISNSFQSNQGIVSIMGSFPSPPQIPFFNSPYSTNKMKGIGYLLGDEGYSTFFAMGAEPDHFGFKRFMKMLGIQKYIDKDQYGNKNHEDGNWGVYDHYFLPFVANQINEFDQPFLGVLYNLSSHPPFTLPSNWQGVSEKKQMPYQDAISYVDFALQLFFAQAKKSGWFDSTYFVFISDHGIAYDDESNKNWTSRVSIPFFIYHPKLTTYQPVSTLAQQWDMLPTLLDLLGYPKSFFSFGESVFRKKNPVVYNLMDNSLRIYKDEYLAEMNLEDRAIVGLYTYKTDSMLLNNLVRDTVYKQLLPTFRQLGTNWYQEWFQAMENDKMLVK
ncbi:MAG: LTA synthase family protein [Flavihumibacter sp.]|nr:LTA synthase family protein [Flavihumibacter sp.]